MQEELDPNQMYATNTKKIPDFLLVLLILTGLNVGYNIFKSLKELFVGAQSATEIESVFYEQLSSSGQDLSAIPEWIMTGIMEFMTKYAENAIMIRVVDLIYYLALGLAAFMMYQLRLMGYYIYVAVNIIGLLVTPVLYGFNFIGISMLIMFTIAAGLFIALYSANRKHLN
jgi:hypothetical protein